MKKPLKPFLKISEQADLMIGRGCRGKKEEIEAKLRGVNYYRLSGYSFLFREPSGENFVSGTTIDKIWRLYLFDRQLRLLVLDAVERVEIALRTRVAYNWAKLTQKSNPQDCSNSYRKSFLQNKNREAISHKELKIIESANKYFENSTDDSIVHHKKNYEISSALELPVWVFVELLTFGDLVALLSKGLKNEILVEVAKSFGFERDEIEEFKSIIVLFREARNHCAHHSRFWNRKWLKKNSKSQISADALIAPEIKKSCELNVSFLKSSGKWENRKNSSRMSFDRRTTISLLAFLSYFIEKIAPKSRWRFRLVTLISETISEANFGTNLFLKFQKEIGIVTGWESHPLFKI